MPNGKPGDDWYTDTIAHGLATFSPSTDRLVHDIAKASGEVRHQPLAHLWIAISTALDMKNSHPDAPPSVWSIGT